MSKQRIFVWLLMIVMLLAACSSQTEKEEGTKDHSGSNDSASGEKVTIRVLSSDDFAGFREKIIPEFEKKYPNIHVELEHVAYDQLHDKELAAFNSGGDGAYDVVDVDEIWTAEYAEAGFIKPVDDYLTDEMKEGILPSSLGIVTYQDHYYCLPMFNDVLFFYYNEELLKKAGYNEPPKTWKEFVEVSKALQEKGLVEGYASNWGWSANEGLICYFTQFLGSFGGKYFDENGNPVFNDTHGVQALQFMIDLINKEKVVDPAAISANDRQILDAFKNGKTAFVSGWSFYWGELNSEDSPVKGKVKVALTPGANGTISSTATGSMYLAISEQSQHPEEAWKFIEFLASKEIQKKQSLEAGSLPIWKDLYNDPDLVANHGAFQEMGKQLEHTLSRPSLVFYNEFSKTLQIELQAALIGQKSAAEALNAAAEKAKELLKQ